MAPRRVAFVVRASRGGMSRHVVELLGRLPRERFEPVALLAPEDEHMRAALAEMGVPFVPVAITDRVDPFADRTTANLIGEALTGLAPDLVHLHSNKAALVGTAAVRRMSLRPATVFTAHNVPSFEKAGFIRRRLGRSALRRVGRGVDRTIAVSYSLATLLTEDIGFDPERVGVVHNGIDAAAITAAVAASDHAALRLSAGIPAGAQVVGTVGRLVRDKGVEVLLRAVAGLVARHPDVRCVIVGDGPDEPRLRSIAAEHGIADRVVFTGFVENPYPWLGAFDAFALPTLLEAFGMAALEAMAVGLPVVASQVGGVPEVVTDGIDGVLVRPGEAAALCDALGCVLSDAPLRDRIGAEAAVTARERFTLDHMTAQTTAVYDAALGA